MNTFELTYYIKDDSRAASGIGGADTESVVFQRHCHSHYELLFVLSGQVTLTAEELRSDFAAHTAVLIPPGVYHTVKGSDYKRCVVTFSSDFLPEAWRQQVKGRQSQAMILTGGEIDRVCTRLSTAVALCGSDNGTGNDRRTLYDPLIRALLTQALYYMLIGNQACESSSDRIDTDVSDNADLLHRAIEYIDAHISRPFPLSEMAKDLGLSESTLSHLFRKAMHISPGQYILQKRVTCAKFLLRDGVPKTEVARRCGYLNYPSFYKVFCRMVGMSPSEYAAKAQ